MREVSEAWVRRLNGLPPFWLAFLFILALGFPSSILALPIAVTSVGAPGRAGVPGSGGAPPLASEPREYRREPRSLLFSCAV